MENLEQLYEAILTGNLKQAVEVTTRAIAQEAGLRDEVKVMIGGAPINQNYASEIGADGYSSNANAAVVMAKQLLEK